MRKYGLLSFYLYTNRPQLLMIFTLIPATYPLLSCQNLSIIPWGPKCCSSRIFHTLCLFFFSLSLSLKSLVSHSWHWHNQAHVSNQQTLPPAACSYYQTIFPNLGSEGLFEQLCRKQHINKSPWVSMFEHRRPMTLSYVATVWYTLRHFPRRGFWEQFSSMFYDISAYSLALNTAGRSNWAVGSRWTRHPSFHLLSFELR